MVKWVVIVATVFYIVLDAVGLAQPQIPPAPTSSIYVQDNAGVLSSEIESKINKLGRKIATQSRAQVVVLTVDSLNGESIQDYALAVLREWRIGDKQLNNGVVFLVDVGGKQSRIEVGYGLEGALNDAKVGRIIDEYALPHFQNGDYNQGIWNGYKAIMREVSKEYGIVVTGDTRAPPANKANGLESQWNSLPWWLQAVILGAVILLLIVDWLFFGGSFTYLILTLIRFRGGDRSGYGGGSGGGGGADRKW